MTRKGWTVETVSAVDAEIAFEALPVAVRAQTAAELTHAESARRLATTQSAVARLGGSRVSSSYVALRRCAAATGTRLTVGLVRDDGRGMGPRSSSPG